MTDRVSNPLALVLCWLTALICMSAANTCGLPTFVLSETQTKSQIKLTSLGS